MTGSVLLALVVVTAIRGAIATVTQPGDAGIARVRSHLAAGGWPLAPRDSIA